jgi:hypothetical protein
MKLHFLAYSAIALASVLASAPARAADGTGTANATVVRPIAIGNSSPNLRFGSFSTTGAGQTVAVATDGARTLVGVLGVSNSQSAFGAASFNVSGEAGMTYAITLPTTINITTGGGGAAETMEVSSFVSNPSGTGTLSGTAGSNSSGSQTLLVGATLTTVASQATGSYTGNFTVTVQYN